MRALLSKASPDRRGIETARDFPADHPGFPVVIARHDPMQLNGKSGGSCSPD